MCFDEDVLAGDPVNQMISEVLAHLVIMRSETNRKHVAVAAVARMRMSGGVNIDDVIFSVGDRRHRISYPELIGTQDVTRLVVALRRAWGAGFWFERLFKALALNL